jgi:WD40 repeat protein
MRPFDTISRSFRRTWVLILGSALLVLLATGAWWLHLWEHEAGVPDLEALVASNPYENLEEKLAQKPTSGAKLVATLKCPGKSWIHAGAISPRGGLLAVSCVDGQIHLWDMKNQALVGSLSRDGMPMDWGRLSFDQTGEFLAAGGYRDTALVLWDLKTKSEKKLLGYGDSVRFSPSGSVLATSSGDGRIELWDGRTFESKGVIPGRGLAVGQITFSPDEQYLTANADWGTYVLLWDLKTKQEVRRLPIGGKSSDKPVVFVRPGVIAYGGSVLEIWDLRLPRQLKIINSVVASVALDQAETKQGTLLATGSFLGTVQVLDVASEKEIAFLKAPENKSRMTLVLFTGNGTGLITATKQSDVDAPTDGEIKIWKLELVSE